MQYWTELSNPWSIKTRYEQCFINPENKAQRSGRSLVLSLNYNMLKGYYGFLCLIMPET